MPLTITDRTLRTAYKALEKKNLTAATLDDLEPLLAKVADRSGLTMTAADQQLKLAVSTQEKLSIVKEGMSDKEKADLIAILDNGDVPLSSDAKQFLENLVGRAPVNATTGPVDISSMKLVGGKVEIEGSAAPNVTVEALNLSLIPRDRLHDDDTFVLGQTDANGKLTGETAVNAGDWLRLRTRDASGTTSDWMVVRADQLGRDTENAVIALQRLDITDAGNGQVALANNNNSRPLSEPYAKVQFTNTRTGEKTVIDLDDTGRLPGVPKLNGKGGDSFDVAVSDGRNNTDFTTVAGTLAAQGGASGTNDVDEPLPHNDDRTPDGKSRYDLVQYTGPLFSSSKADYTEVIQGNLGDCFTPAGAAALALVQPELLPMIIRKPTAADRAQVNAERAKRGEQPLADNADYYVVEFKQDPDGNPGKWLEPVDAKLYTRSWGGPLYGSMRGSTDPDKMQLWFPIFEKAWAQYSGSDQKPGDYNDIGNGGASSTIFQAVLGRPALNQDFNDATKDRCFQIIKDKLARKLPVCLGTKDDKGNEAIFANTGVYGDHTYTVLDAYEKNGEKYIKLRNPWGESEPPGNGENDGIFELKLDDMPKWYSVLWSVQ
jgi:hypothetical protein